MTAEEPPLIHVLADAMRMSFGKALGQYVVLEVDGGRVEGEVDSIGTRQSEARWEPNSGTEWYVEIKGERYTISAEELLAIADGGTTGG